MGTSGDRKGYKIFSINTTVRNPKRNTDFLTYFKPYDGQVFTEVLAHSYFFDLVANGVYRLTNISEDIKNKIENGIKLSAQEAIESIKNNPQATGLYGRVMTQLRSMKDQGFLMFDSVKRGENRIHITSLGYELIDNKIDATFTYTKAMIGMHAHSPIRTTMLNKSRPFLNTLFVINEVNKIWRELGNEAKGLLQHEFAVFVLSMTDCDYRSAAKDIIEYRTKFRYEINLPYLFDYLNQKGILPLATNSLLKDYPDEVFRKFEMTGLIIKRGAFKYIYYDFSAYNFEKIQSILTEYSSYGCPLITAEQFNEIIKIINIYLIRRSICGLDTSDITRLFPVLLKDVILDCNKDYSKIVEYVKKNLINKQRGKSAAMPDDEQLRNYLEYANVNASF